VACEGNIPTWTSIRKTKGKNKDVVQDKKYNSIKTENPKKEIQIKEKSPTPTRHKVTKPYFCLGALGSAPVFYPPTTGFPSCAVCFICMAIRRAGKLRYPL
jgi:hypothetical protein